MSLLRILLGELWLFLKAVARGHTKCRLGMAYDLRTVRIRRRRVPPRSPECRGRSAATGSAKCATPVKWNRRAAAVRVTKLFVRPFLPDLFKAERNESRHDFRRLENRQLAFRQRSAHLYRLGSDELRFHGRLAILEQHLDNFGQIRIQFFDRFALGMRAGKAGNISNVCLLYTSPSPRD